MSTMVVRVCEECGQQFTQRESWLVVDSLDVRHGRTSGSLLHVDAEMDFCSTGCFIRYVSRTLEHSVAHLHHAEEGEKQVA